MLLIHLINSLMAASLDQPPRNDCEVDGELFSTYLNLLVLYF